jgi:GNAT superfamily N-acetyltransferase
MLALQEIEWIAGQRFQDFGLDDVADNGPAPVEVLTAYIDRGHAWVALNPDEAVAGYILVHEVDGAGHIEQVSVLPAYQGQGFGRALVGRAEVWARASGFGRVTLTTFNHIPWNQPLYEHLGYRVLTDDEIGPGLRVIRQEETNHGLDPALRVAMVRTLDAT